MIKVRFGLIDHIGHLPFGLKLSLGTSNFFIVLMWWVQVFNYEIFLAPVAI